MKILIMGSGAVGGYYGAVLNRSGHEVTFVARGEHLRLVRENGLQIRSVTSGTFVSRVEVTDRTERLKSYDLVLFCVKSYDNESAINLIRPVVGDNTTVLTLQNGIGSGVQLCSVFGDDKVLLGVTYVDAALQSPGVVAEFGGPGRLIFGEIDQLGSGRSLMIRDAFVDAGVNVELSDCVESELWRKFLYICAWSGMICITRSSMDQILAYPGTERMTINVMKEVQLVAREKGIDIADSDIQTAMQTFRDSTEDSVSSMFIDLQSGKPLEIDVLNGAVARMGAKYGVTTPANNFIYECLTVPHQQALARRTDRSR